MENKVRVVAYIRVSTNEQAIEGYSLDAQEEMALKYCQMHGKELVRTYVDSGISGKSTEKRLQLQQLLQDSKKDVFDEVVVWKTSRMARNTLELLQIVKELESNSTSFKSLSESYDTTTPQGKLMMNVLASFAEFERTSIIENLRLGMDARARLGYKNGGKLLGYRSEGKVKESKLVIVEEEAEIVRLIFKKYSEGEGYKAIANSLNKLGYRSVKGNHFSINTIKEILDNPTYVGIIRHNRYVDYSTKRRGGANENYIFVEGKHQAIIDQDTWDKVRMIQAKKGGRYNTKNKGKFPLTGILRCPACGAGMVASTTVNTLKDGTKRRIRYYSCGNFKNKGSSVCSANSVRADEAENYVFKRIKEVLINQTILMDIVGTMNRERNEKVEPLLKNKELIEKKINETVIKKNKVFELFEDGIIGKEALASRLELIDKQLSDQEEEIYRINSQLEDKGKGEIPYRLIKEVFADFKSLMDNAEPQQRKLFLQLVIDKITVTEGKIKNIHIHFNETIRSLIDMYLDKEEPSDEGSSSSFVFKIAI